MTKLIAKNSAAMGLIEAAHDGQGDWTAWCQRLLGAARELLTFEHVTVGVMRRGERRFDVFGAASSVDWFVDGLVREIPEVPATDLDPFARYQTYVGTMATTLRGEMPGPGLQGFVKTFSATDLLGLVAIGDDVSLVFSCPVSEQLQVSPRERILLCQVLSHVETGLRVRLNPDAQLAVLQPDGRLLHAAGAARRDAGTREQLSRHVASIERSRTRRERQTLAGVDAWSALIAGVWGLVERVDSDGARHYIVIETPRSRRLRALSVPQMNVVELSARGLTGKAIAYALGVSEGSVSKSLADAALKLGISNRTELVRLVARLLDTGPVRAPEVELTSAERDVLGLVRLGWSNSKIAQARARSEHTIANQVAALLRKMNVPSRRSLASLTEASCAAALS